MSRGRAGAERGAALVEFALVLPLLMTILMGILDYGYVYYVRLTMTNAAREGARVGATRDDDAAADAAETAAQTYLASAGITASVAATTPSHGAPAVTVVVTVSPFTPLVGFLPTPASMEVSASMRWELASPP